MDNYREERRNLSTSGMDKIEWFAKLQKRMRLRVFSTWGIQTGPFAAQLLHFHTGEPFLITPECQ